MNEKLNLLRRYFGNKYSRNDYLTLRKLFFSENNEAENLMSRHWNEFRPNQAEHDLSEVKTSVNRAIGSASGHLLPKRFFHTYSKIAAVLLLPVLLALGLLYFQFNHFLFQKDVFVEIQTPSGSRTHLNLPDGSAVWLNGDSYIRYPAAFSGTREVEIAGEAFFKVKSDKEHPFLVSANNLYVRATGTEFNVLAYKDEPELSVILKKGKVDLLNARKSELRKIETGHQLCYSKDDSSIKYSEVNAEEYSGWIDGKLIFRNASMKEVMLRMEHWYGVDIEIMDQELLKLHFKATFINESVEEALKLLQSTATFHYRFAERKAGKNGLTENAKIYITKN